MNIDWNKAPVWANAVISSKDGTEYYVSQFGGISARQRVGYSEVDDNASADMIIPHDWTLVATRNSPWFGEGLPPAGTVCEYRVGSGTWYPCEVRYITKPIQDEEVQVVVHCPNLSGDQIGGIGSGIGEINFRPARTSEQIAADERESKAKEMYLSVYFAEPEEGWGRIPETTRETFRKAIDAGWQKVLP